MMFGNFNSFGFLWIHLFCVFGWILLTGWLLFMIWAIKFMKKEMMLKAVAWLVAVGIVGGLIAAVVMGTFMGERWNRKFMMKGWQKNPAIETCRENAKTCFDTVKNSIEEK